jgi:predicted anti-sigma-YlaC factor YlaD
MSNDTGNEMICAYDERVAAYASGEADPILEAHLPGCTACRAELAASRVLLGALAQLARSERDLPTRDLAGLGPSPPVRRRRPWRLAAPIVLAAAIIGLVVVRSGQAPRQAPAAVGQSAAGPAALLADDASDGASDSDSDSDSDDVGLVAANLDPLDAIDDLSDQDVDDALAQL